jgi:hypothetical protein
MVFWEGEVEAVDRDYSLELSGAFPDFDLEFFWKTGKVVEGAC